MLKQVINRLLQLSHIKRTIFFVSIDALVIISSLLLAFFIRFEFMIPNSYVEMIFVVLPLFLGVKLVNFIFFRLYRMTWRFVGSYDLWNIVLSRTRSPGPLYPD